MTEPNFPKTTKPERFSRWHNFLVFTRFRSQGGALPVGGRHDTHRIALIVLIMLIFGAVVVYRAYILQIRDKDAIIKEGNEFLIGNREVAVSRGMITDRFGTPLAANGALVDMAFSPYDYAEEYYRLKGRLKSVESDALRQNIQKKLDEMDLAILAKASGVPLERLQKAVAIDETVDVSDSKAVKAVLPYNRDSKGNILHDDKGRPLPYRWLSLMTKVTPEQADALYKLEFVGVSRKLYQQRYYLQGELMGQVLGYLGETKKDPVYRSRAGIELQYDSHLAGQKGKVQILKGVNGTSIRQLKETQPAVAGQDVALTIDSRLQYILFRELEALGRHQSAMWTSGIITDIHTGEILAMGAWPSFNNNNLTELVSVNGRNRPLVDSFEAGSVMKPFTVAAALESGKYNLNTTIDTGAGTLKVGGTSIFDGGHYGVITLATLIQKSSNIGSAKIALSLPNNAIADMQRKFGFGKKSPIEFPSEATGVVNNPKNEGRRATLAYGYGQRVTLAQLAQAYATLGAEGSLHPLRLVKTAPQLPAVQVISPKNAKAIVQMMELVTMKGGTGELASIDGYRVAGKTGTARRYSEVQKKYSRESYRNIFAGVVPASNPRFAVVILAEDPQGSKVAGKSVAPAFAKVAEETLRLYNVPYDKPLAVENTDSTTAESTKTPQQPKEQQ